MTTFESRLDRIEAILERNSIDINTLVQRLDQITVNTERDREQAERDRRTLVDTVSTLSTRLDQIATNAEQERLTTRAVVRELVETAEADRLALVDSIAENKEKITTLTERFDRFMEEAAADRQQAALDRTAWSAEIRRIWEYLLRQGNNGHSAA